MAESGARALARAVALAACCALGCVVFADHPLVGETPGVLDPALAGSWIELSSDDDDARDVITFTAHGDHYVASEPSSHVSVELTTALVAGERYLSARTVGEEAQGYTLGRYALHGDRIAVAPLDYDAARRLVESGELAGELTQSAPGDTKPDERAPLRLHASSADLEKLLRRLGPNVLFPELRDAWVRPPADPPAPPAPTPTPH